MTYVYACFCNRYPLSNLPFNHSRQFCYEDPSALNSHLYPHYTEEYNNDEE